MGLDQPWGQGAADAECRANPPLPQAAHDALAVQMEATSVWLAVMDTEGTVQRLNAAMQKAVAAGEPVGHHVSAVLEGALSSEDAELLRSSVRSCVEDGGEVPITVPVRLPTGEEKTMDIHLTPVPGSEGGVAGVVLAASEVTSWNRSVQSLKHWGESMYRLVDCAGVPFFEAPNYKQHQIAVPSSLVT